MSSVLEPVFVLLPVLAVTMVMAMVMMTMTMVLMGIAPKHAVNYGYKAQGFDKKIEASRSEVGEAVFLLLWLLIVI